jgi:hypothetical protein
MVDVWHIVQKIKVWQMLQNDEFSKLKNSYQFDGTITMHF